MVQQDFLKLLYSVPHAYSFRLSPDRKWIAWVWFNVGRSAQVYAAPTDASRPPLKLSSSKQDTFLLSWLPDTSGVLVKQDNKGDERFQLLRIDLKRPGKMIPLTEKHPPYFTRGGRMHPNGNWLVFGANYDKESGKVVEPTYIYRRDLTTGEWRILAKPLKAAFTVPQLNEQGSYLIYNRNDLHPSGSQLWLASTEGAEDTEIVNVGTDKQAYGRWFPDGKRILVVADQGDHRKFGVYSLERRSMEWVLDDRTRNLEEAFAPRGTDQIILTQTVATRSVASLFDLKTRREWTFPDVPGELLPVDLLADGRWVGEYSGAQYPFDMVRFHAKETDPKSFETCTRFWTHTSLRPEDLTRPKDVRWKSVDGREIQGWLYRAKAPKGTIAIIHGGPTGASFDDFDAQAQYFVSRGFSVFEPNYRGSTGFGLAFESLIKKDGWGGREQDDIRTGIEALIAQGTAQKGKIGITGTSYGGYSSWCAITRYSTDTVAAAAPICGMTDLVLDYYTTRPDLRTYSEEMMGGSPKELPELYHERSPLHYIHNIRGRLFIIQGANDPNVTPQNVEAVKKELKRNRIPFKLLVFKDEGHGVIKTRNQRALVKRLADFFGKSFAAH